MMLKGMLIERMVPPGLVELIVGLQTDPRSLDQLSWLDWVGYLLKFSKT